MQSPDILIPSVPAQYRGQQISPVLEYELPTNARCMSWNDDELIIGHDLGVLILARHETADDDLIAFRSFYHHLGLSVDLVKGEGPFLAAVHPDFSVTFVANNEEGPTIIRYDGNRSHDSFINAVDISPEGVLATTGDDRKVLVHDTDDTTREIALSQAGRAVKFRQGQNANQLLILEESNKISIFDWTRCQWLVTVFIGSCPDPVSHLGLLDDTIMVAGTSWWKTYHIESLKGGCGYTQSFKEGRLFGPAQTSRTYSACSQDNARYLVNISSQGLDVHDLHSSGEHPIHIDYPLSGSVTAASIRRPGDTVAVVSSRRLILFRR